MSWAEYTSLNRSPLGGMHFFERTSRAIQVGASRAYAKTWVVNPGAQGYGQALMLQNPPQVVATVGSLQVLYAPEWGYYVYGYPQDFASRAEAVAFARSLQGAPVVKAGLPWPLILLALLLV